MADFIRAYGYPGNDILPRVIRYVVVNVVKTNVKCKEILTFSKFNFKRI